MVELKTIAINMTIILFFLNAGPAALQASGVAQDMGIDPSVSGDDAIGEANEAMQNETAAQGGFGGTLFGLFTAVTQPVTTVMDVITAGPNMLISAGVPTWLVAFVFAPQYLIVGGTVIYVLAGRLL